MKYDIANQNRQDAKGILKSISKAIYDNSSSQQLEEAQSNEPLKTQIEASAFFSYESDLVIRDVNENGYDGLAHIVLGIPYLQQQLNRRGNVKIMIRVKCWVISKNTGERHEYSFTARQLKCSRMA